MFAQISQRKLSLLGKIGVMLYGLIAGAAAWFTTLVASFLWAFRSEVCRVV